MSRDLGYCIFTFEGGDWSKDDFAGLDQGFVAAKEIGFSYVEIPSYVYHAGAGRTDIQFLHRIGRILEMSERHGVPLSAIFAAAELLDPGIREEEADHLVVLARLASTMGIKALPVTLSMTHASHGTEEAALLGKVLSEVGHRTLACGVRIAAHPHIGCPVENPEQIAAFCAAADPASVGLCLDTGHVLAGGGDPVKIAAEFGDRVVYVHLKDLDSHAYATASDEGREKYKAFRDPGQGDVDFVGVMHELDRHGFDGPVLAENDMSPDARGSMERAYTYLRTELKL